MHMYYTSSPGNLSDLMSRPFISESHFPGDHGDHQDGMRLNNIGVVSHLQFESLTYIYIYIYGKSNDIIIFYTSNIQ